ncbi:acetoacetate--CoA ligase [Mycolicibacterium komossense]|uniref:Acetoacetate--CoA ligase n=1 Tax=Mycolicibacterium komossense TaxID=1779 RepID=A0ABT3C9L3_9MYCO|nr:acetoacetate--CoA ligase [Mycolicibacterium komossense]MCV7226165.1 acetoacetate--CoA ligase [Mycolicibacterium komossense]
MSTAGAEQPLWSPEQGCGAPSNLESFIDHLRVTRGLDISDYQGLWEWSVAEIAEFWAAIWEYFDLDCVSGYDEVLSVDALPGAQWFSGARINFADHLLRGGSRATPAVIVVDESGNTTTLTWDELRQKVSALATALDGLGVAAGDVVAGYLPNSAEAVIAFLAAASLGAVWSVVGLDYAAPAVVDRFAQLRPTVLIAATGYRYNGVLHDRADAIDTLASALADSVIATVVVGREGCRLPATRVLQWDDLTVPSPNPVTPLVVDFDHPLWVLFTSGTTGIPKGLVHSHGGILVEMLKQLALHWDVTASDRVFWYTSTSWVMWNLQVSTLLLGGSIVCYDGSPTYPDVAAMWRLVAAHQVTFFGTSPGYLHASAKAGLTPGTDFDLTALRALGCTGSPLAPDVHRWALEHVGKKPVWSMSGGTDVASAFAGGAPNAPVWAGELSTRCLAVAAQSWDERGTPVAAGEVGELVITRPMPSMPIRLWNDTTGERYRTTYFGMFPDAWRQGDWVTITARGSVVIHGRSDATLNRNGIRMGSADIYAAVETFPQVTESLVVGVDRTDGSYWMPLFVTLAPQCHLDESLIAQMKLAIGQRASPRHIPDDIIAVRGIPHTRTGKKLEVPVKRMLQGAAAAAVVSPDAVDDASLFDDFAEIARTAGQSPQRVATF